VARTPRSERARLRVDPIACDGRGLCAELLPELITIDDWGFPIISDNAVPAHLMGDARVTVRACPKLALRLEHSATGRRGQGVRRAA
jgi:ferredoxin